MDKLTKELLELREQYRNEVRTYNIQFQKGLITEREWIDCQSKVCTEFEQACGALVLQHTV